MRYSILLFTIMSTFLYAVDEFAYIQPIAIEESHTIISEEQNLSHADLNTTTKKQKVKEIEEKDVEEKDSDGDGIIDSRDQCSNTSTEFIIDNNGCPQIEKIDIQFESKKYDVTPTILDQVQSLANFLLQNTNYQVVIYGYTDSVGNEDDNKALSQKRATAVKKALIAHGVSSTKLTAIGNGEENPIADNSTQSGRELNRRIEIELIN